jgi:hypothetical protein
MPLSFSISSVVPAPVAPVLAASVDSPFKQVLASGPLMLVVWSMLGMAGLAGVIALVSPRHFAAIARAGNHWVDTSKWFAKLDSRVDVDSRLLPYSRQLGALVIASVGLLAFVLVRR